MSFRVLRYKNYGCTMTAGEDADDWKHMFYWSFYELSNGHIINLHYTENWEKNKFIDADFEYHYTKYELNNGDIICYVFGNAKADDDEAMSKEFFKWFESQPPYHHIKNPTRPSLEEEKCIKAFFEKNINKDQKTDTIHLNE